MSKIKYKPGIPIYYMCDDVIKCELAVAKDGKRVILEDGGWVPDDNCFFTKNQCETFHASTEAERNFERLREHVLVFVEGIKHL